MHIRAKRKTGYRTLCVNAARQGAAFFPPLLLALTRPLCADAAEEGYWYLDEFGVREIHEEDITGKGVKLADIDTLVNLDLPWLSDANVVLRDKAITKFYGDIGPESDDFGLAYHATDMVGLLQGNGRGASMGQAQIGIAPDITIYHYAAVHTDDDSVTGGDLYAEAMECALEDNVDIIFIPAGGLSDYKKQYPFFLEAIKRGIPVLVAHANERHRIDQDSAPEVYDDGQGGELLFEELPTASWKDEICYWPGLVTVQALDEQFRVQVLSRTEDAGTDISSPGEGIWMQTEDWGYFEPMSGGCSAATTSAAGFLALAMEKWPDATGNQILQLMARTPEWQSQEAAINPKYDILNLEISPFYGWGAIDIQYMLQTDPTAYPDVNPVLYKDVAQIVKNAEIRGETSVLKEKELIEIAKVLDDQIRAARMERPAFLKKVLGNDRGTSGSGAEETDSGEEDPQQPGTQPDPSQAGEGNGTSAATDTQTNKDPDQKPSDKPDKPEGKDVSGARNGIAAPLICFLSALGTVVTVTVFYMIKRPAKPKKKKKRKILDEEEEE